MGFAALRFSAWKRVAGLLLATMIAATPAAIIAQEKPAELRGHGGPVRAMALLDDGQTLVTGGFDSALIAWDTATGQAKRVLRFHASTVNSVTALRAGCFASGGEDGKIALWCGLPVAPQHVLEGHTAPVTHAALSPDGRHLASVSFDRTLRIWPLDRGEKAAPRVIDGFDAPLSAVTFLSDAVIATAGYDGAVRIHRLDGAPQPRALMLGVPVNAITAAPGGTIVVAGADGFVRRVTAELAVVAEIDIGSGPLTALAVTPDGRFIATAGMRTQVTMIEVATGKTAFEILGPGLPVWSLAFSADGATLYTGGQDKTVRRWITATGKPAGVEAGVVAADPLPFATERGAALFGACQACHGVTLEDSLKAGPTLAGIFGRKIATAPGYAYSEALKRLDIVWDARTIGELFTVGPAVYTPGTKMPEQVLTNAEDRDALIAWLAKATR